MKLIPKPTTDEYTSYATMYIDLLPDDGRILNHLQENLENLIQFLRSLPAEKQTTPHAMGEWTVNEIIVHIIDTERIYGYRALRYARNDATELSGFEQNEYVPYSDANSRELEEIIEELSSVRMATITLFNSFSEEALKRKGMGNGTIMSVRAVAYFIAGHELHHISSIKENYT